MANLVLGNSSSASLRLQLVCLRVTEVFGGLRLQLLIFAAFCIRTPISEAHSPRLGRTLKNSQQSMLKEFRKIGDFGSSTITIMGTLIFRGPFFGWFQAKTSCIQDNIIAPRATAPTSFYVPPFPLYSTLALSLEGRIRREDPRPNYSEKS